MSRIYNSFFGKSDKKMNRKARFIQAARDKIETGFNH